MQKFKTLLTVIGAVTILVLAANSAVYAATGGKFILGHTNKANAVSTLKRTTSGAALKLTTNSSSNAPLSTNGKGKVSNLNADKVDGLSSGSLRNHSIVFTKSISVATDFFSVTVPAAVGTYEFSYSAFLIGADSGWAFCQIVRDRASLPNIYVGIEQIQAPVVLTPGVSGAGVVTKATGDTLTFECGAQSAFTTDAAVPIQLVLTPTVKSSSGSLRTAPSPSGARVAGK
jgi:hypothetical protein